jgi:nucleoside-diphosphate-sugar epimerase
MATNTKNILIFGATGLIGEHITNAIVESKADFGRIAVFTSNNTIQSKAEEINSLKSRGVEIIAGDITSAEDINKALNGFDTVVSCVGRPIIHTQVQIVELMDKHPDVKRFFPSEYGTDIEYDSTSVDEKPHQQKLKVRAALKKVKDLEYTYVVTGPYGDADGGLFLGAAPPEAESGGTFDVKRRRAVLLDDGNGKISLTTMRDVGKLVVAALKAPEATKNKALKVNSFTTTPKEIVAEYEKQTGQKWEVSYTSLDELKELERQAWEKQDSRAGGLTLRRIWTSGRTLYEHRDNDVIGMEDKMETLESAVEQAIKVQTGRTL